MIGATAAGRPPRRPIVAGPRPAPTAPRPATASAAKADVVVPAKADVVVPGEELRTALCMAALAISPLVQATQTVGMLARASFANPLLARGAAAVVGLAGLVAGTPLLNNAFTRGALRACGIALPFINAGILAFDAFASWKTLTNPAASPTRKWLTGARFGANAIATALSFVPGNGAVLAMAPAWLSIGLDLWIKRLNAKDGA